MMIRRLTRSVSAGLRNTSLSYKWLTCRLLRPAQCVFVQGCQYHKTYWSQDTCMEIKGRVIVYSILGCPHCMKAKNTLENLQIPFTDISLDRYPQCREYVQQHIGKKTFTVPQIFFNSYHVGGNSELQELIANQESSKFKQLLEDIKTNEAGPDAPQPPDPSTAIAEEGAGSFVCEPDEYAELVRELRNSGLIKDRGPFFNKTKNAFIGKEFVDWMVEKKGLERMDAVLTGQALIDRHFGHNLQTDHHEKFEDSPNSCYRLMEDDETTALNGGEVSECEPLPAGELGEDIRKLILKIYNAFLSKDGRKVDYRGIAGSSEFEVYVKLTKQLQRVQITEASREEKLSFFINVYNALVIHANVVKGPPVNLWQRYKFFNTVRYIIGGWNYSLQDIENGVLRGNRKGVGMLFKPFGKSDPRLKVALETHEPYIHFALVCGAKSCPPIKTYSTEGIYDQLKMAAEAFLEGDDGCQINMVKKEVRLSMILKWYMEDFGKNTDEILLWVEKNLPEGEKKSQLSELIAGHKYNVKYLKYDWGLNS